MGYLLELSDEVGTGIPLIIISTLFIEPSHIRNQLEGLAFFQTHLEKLRLYVGPGQFRRWLKYEINILLQTNAINLMENGKILAEGSYDELYKEYPQVFEKILKEVEDKKEKDKKE